MAWASVGTLGTVGSATANQASLVLTTSAALEAGNVGVVLVAVDNNQTTDGDEGAVSGVVDSAGNTWIKGREFTNGQGAAQAGIVCSLWYVLAGTTLASGGTITISFTNATSRDASSATAWEYTVAAGSTISVAGTNTLAEDAATNPASLDVTTANAEHLRIRAVAEENNGTTFTQTAGWTKFTDAQSAGGGGSAAKVAIHGEFHISTGTGDASDPSGIAAVADLASVYVALLETLSAGQPMAKRVGGVTTAGAREGFGGEQSRRRW